MSPLIHWPSALRRPPGPCGRLGEPGGRAAAALLVLFAWAVHSPAPAPAGETLLRANAAGLDRMALA